MSLEPGRLAVTFVSMRDCANYVPEKDKRYLSPIALACYHGLLLPSTLRAAGQYLHCTYAPPGSLGALPVHRRNLPAH
jgi:hypothetical protein